MARRTLQETVPHATLELMGATENFGKRRTIPRPWDPGKVYAGGNPTWDNAPWLTPAALKDRVYRRPGW